MIDFWTDNVGYFFLIAVGLILLIHFIGRGTKKPSNPSTTHITPEEIDVQLKESEKRISETMKKVQDLLKQTEELNRKNDDAKKKD